MPSVGVGSRSLPSCLVKILDRRQGDPANVASGHVVQALAVTRAELQDLRPARHYRHPIGEECCNLGEVWPAVTPRYIK